jgi:hypothetical protein
LKFCSMLVKPWDFNVSLCWFCSIIWDNYVFWMGCILDIMIFLSLSLLCWHLIVFRDNVAFWIFCYFDTWLWDILVIVIRLMFWIIWFFYYVIYILSFDTIQFCILWYKYRYFYLFLTKPKRYYMSHTYQIHI